MKENTLQTKCPFCEPPIEKCDFIIDITPYSGMPYKVTSLITIFDGEKWDDKEIGKVFACSNGHVFNTWDGTQIKKTPTLNDTLKALIKEKEQIME
jgi:hypothetical protein